MTESSDRPTNGLNRLKWWRQYLSRIATALIFLLLLYWSWQNWALLYNTFARLGIVNLAILVFLLCLALVLSIFTFTILVRGMGYSFTWQDGYHSLNLSQIAAMVPGKIWGFAGLAALLINRGISKQDSALIITLNTVIMIYASVLIGAGALTVVIGWAYTFVCFIPLLVLLLGRNRLERWRGHYLTNSSPLPSTMTLMKALTIGVISWSVVSFAFVLLVYSDIQSWPVSPFLVAGSLPAGYVAGFLALITPSGLGVSEGVIALILGPSLGLDKALALAVSYRIVHMSVLWINIGVTLIMLSLSQRLATSIERNHIELINDKNEI